MQRVIETQDIELDIFLKSLKKGDVIEVYTDGSCIGNPGPGGWGIVFECKAKRATLSGSEKNTTNNRMEMMASINAIKTMPDGVKAIIYTDSMYLKSGITQWIVGWKLNGWKSSTNKPVKNKDLWLELDSCLVGKNVEWSWVKGHGVCINNNNADFVARSAVISSYMSEE